MLVELILYGLIVLVLLLVFLILLFAEHRFEGAQNFKFIVILENLRKLRDFLALFAAGYEDFRSNLELLFAFHLLSQFDLTQFVGAHTLLTHRFVLYDVLYTNRLLACLTSN